MNTNLKLITNTLFHPEDRIPRKNVDIWIDELTSVANLMLVKCDLMNNYGELSRLFNQSGLIYSLIGDISKAKQICHWQLDFFVALSKNDNSLLKYIFQPWINLGRIDRILGDFDESMRKLSILEVLKNSCNLISFNNHLINTRDVKEVMNADKEIKNVIENCLYLEPIKTKLAAKNYASLLQWADQSLSDCPRLMQGIVFEAAMIASAKIGLLDKAVELARRALSETPSNIRHIILLRLGELLSVQDDHEAENIFRKILSLVEYFGKYQVDINKAVFSVKAAGVFLKCGCLEFSIKAYRKALLYSKIVGDELLIIECLESLSAFSKNENDVLNLEKILNTTKYSNILKKYNIKNKNTNNWFEKVYDLYYLLNLISDIKIKQGLSNAKS